MLFHTEEQLVFSCEVFSIKERLRYYRVSPGTPWGYSIIKQAIFDSHVLNKRRIRLQRINPDEKG